MNIDEAYEALNKLIKEFEQKIAALDENQSSRIRALEFATCMYRNDNGQVGDKTATGFISFADEVFNYIKEGKM